MEREITFQELEKQGFERKTLETMSEDLIAPLCAMIQKQLQWANQLEVATQKLAREKTAQEDELAKAKCKICYENDMDVVFGPCNHMLCCANCAEKLKICPICRKSIQTKIHCFST